MGLELVEKLRKDTSPSLQAIQGQETLKSESGSRYWKRPTSVQRCHVKIKWRGFPHSTLMFIKLSSSTLFMSEPSTVLVETRRLEVRWRAAQWNLQSGRWVKSGHLGKNIGSVFYSHSWTNSNHDEAHGLFVTSTFHSYCTAPSHGDSHRRWLGRYWRMGCGWWMANLVLGFRSFGFFQNSDKT